MAHVEKTPDHGDGPELIPVALKLDHDAHELMVELMQRTGWNASELVGWALGAYWREMEGIVLPPPPDEDIEKVLAESEADIATGRTASNEEVFGRIAAKEDFRRHFTPGQIESIERGLADARAGRTVSNKEMFAEIRAKYGW